MMEMPGVAMKDENSSVLLKTRQLLSYLHDFSQLRRDRSGSYRSEDRLLWFHQLQELLPEVRTPILKTPQKDGSTHWLEMTKPEAIPNPPPVLSEISAVFDVIGLQVPEREPELHLRSLPSEGGVRTDHQCSREDVLSSWERYLEVEWRPWAQKARRLRLLDRLYGELDFIRGRTEEAEEQHELVLALGLLAWDDPESIRIFRHLLTARTEILFDARRGVFYVQPEATFDALRVELDMLNLQYQPALEKTSIPQRLEDLADRVWDRQSLADILQELGHLIHTKCSVFAETLEPPSTLPKDPCIYYAPALVLRRRRLPAYERLALLFKGLAEQARSFRAPEPWLKIILEGDAGPETRTSSGNESQGGSADSRLYFPLPTNDAQRSIVDRLRRQPAVLVKGPPGTGKSHTITNLICHLLARGERVLVTAQAPKALDVLLGLLPEDMKALCVASLGSSHEEQQRLKESVDRILANRDKWLGEARAAEELRRLECDIRELEQQAVRLDRRLKELREAEVYPFELPGGYSGTTAAVAQQLQEDLVRYGWVPRPLHPGTEYPLNTQETTFLADFHSGLTQAKLKELTLELGPDDIHSPQSFRELVEQLAKLEARIADAEPASPDFSFSCLARLDDVALESLADFLSELEERSGHAWNWLGQQTLHILKACLRGQAPLWQGALEEAQIHVRKMRECVEIINGAAVEEKKKTPLQEAVAHARQRLMHFRNGGWRGWSFLAPAIVRQTRYVEESYLVDGHSPTSMVDLEKLVAYLEFRTCEARLQDLFPDSPDTPTANLWSILQKASRQSECLERLLQLFGEPAAQLLNHLDPDKRCSLEDTACLTAWRKGVEDAVLGRQHRRLAEEMQKWHSTLASLAKEDEVHPCITRLLQAVRERNFNGYAEAYEERESVRLARSHLERYRLLIDKIAQASPAAADEIVRSQGVAGWRDRLLELPKAWRWAQAMTWLEGVVQPGALEEAAEERSIVEDKIRARVGKLAAMHAWSKFLQRMNEATRQNLVAWQRAIKQVGKGTGIHAERHRRTARRYMMECLPVIPAWIMPLYRVWETVEAQPGLFDTVIIDEASQAGTETLLLLLLAKRIVVVGDDMQNSPEAVGVREQDVMILGEQHLKSFHFRHEYRPDVSFYDHCQRAFGNQISLREHFRCVPEIIRFSNDICYSSDPLIPMRQAPPDRLPPLVSIFVKDASCTGEGQGIRNDAEADAIVRRIEQCLTDKKYEGKSMGVVVLQGHAQAELIERLLARTVPPQVRLNRKLRCGVPATFQGDQRDVIFLSLVIAQNHRFRALTEIEAIRRFNVAMSRARDQVFLFHSVQLADLSVDDLRYRLLRFFLRPQDEELHEEAERLMTACVRTPRRPGNQPDPYESWFEVDVAIELLRRGYKIRPQWEVSGYRIDLVVEGAENRIAVECDGDDWHGLDRLEHDLNRQRQLERAGWRFVRVRASEFYYDREAAMDRIVRVCTENRIWPLTKEVKGDCASSVENENCGGEHACSAEDDSQEADSDEQPDTDEAEEPENSLDEFATKKRGWALPDPRQAPRDRVAEAILSIIREERIVNKRRLFRLYVQYCPGVDRAGKTVRQSLNRALFSLQRVGEIEVRRYGDGSLEFQEIRLRGVASESWDGRGSLRLDEIPPSELFRVIEKVFASMPTGKPVDATGVERGMRAVLERFGLDRLTTHRRKFLEKAFALRAVAAANDLPGLRSV